ncbi:TetR/AcrR family transcriptional regulator [Propylenella binzhouense]|uniref:TetR/AcrR family transcriptional regulator n=1 Tax=Propylenella binzhouense TaxID=2555902 RepID=A0A964T5F1_9HYPH|nr:TetR/AcrR family transcriptional regulator [Propylenella binzhouense]MYZ48851.1 TetR/AcrR family transcriptional regulator [Propylenella binzhouense]
MATAKLRQRIVQTLLALAAERRWDEVTLEAIADRAGVTLQALRSAFDGRIAILDAFVRGIDEQVLAARDPELAEEAPRERLFDILFARIEALLPHRAAIRGLAQAAFRDPLLALELNRMTVRSMSWMLTAAGLPATGIRGAARAQALAVMWSQVMRVFLDDTDPGLARTMAELDRRLRRAERAAIRFDRLDRFLRGRRPPSRRAADDTDTDLAEGHPS